MRRGRNRFAVRVFLYFLFLSLLATIVTAGISYRTAAKLLEDNTYTLVSDTISKFRYYLNDKLAIVTAQYEMLESNPALLRLMMRDYGKHSRASYYDDMKDVLEQFHLVSDNYPDLVDSKLATPISNGGLILTPPGYFAGSARDGVSQYQFYWLPPKEGSTTFFRPLTYHFLPALEYIS